MNVTIYDNGGRSFDKYTVIMHDYDYALGIGPTGNAPNGFCMSIDLDDICLGPHLGDIIGIDEMTDAARAAVLDEMTDAARAAVDASLPDDDQGACILTAENMYTADDCTMHDHERGTR